MNQFEIRQFTQECFSALGRIRDLDPASFPQPDVLYNRIKQSIDTMKSKATQAGMPREDVYEITYALVAHADEIAMNSSSNIQNYWMQQPLQLHYFHETAAGEGFFTRLDAVRADPNRHEVLRVFYLCLLFGFQGSHRIRGGEIALINLIEELRHQIFRVEAVAELLSPRGLPPEQHTLRNSRGFPVVMAGFATLAVSVVAYIAFQSILDTDMENLNQKVQILMSPPGVQSAVPEPATEAPNTLPPGSEFGEEARE